MYSFTNIVTPNEVVALLRQRGVEQVCLWVDDDLVDRAAPKGWVHVTTAFQAMAVIDAFVVVELSLDNDLADDELYGQGKQVVDHICERQVADEVDCWPAVVTLHTANGSARDSMGKTIMAFAPRIHDVHQTMTNGGKRQFHIS